MDIEEEIEIRSEEVNDIVNNIPSWTILWGNTVIFLIIISVFAAMFIIKYPDIIQSQITVTTYLPPAKLVSRAQGKIVELFVKENDKVKNGQNLSIIENTANYKDVLFLKTLINSSNLDTLNKYLDSKELSLGDFQESYLTFYESMKEYIFQLKYYPEKQESEEIELQLKEYKKLLQKLLNQLDIYNEELSLTTKDYNRNLSLFKEKAISEREFEEKKKEMLLARRSFENLKASVSNTKITVNELKKNLSLLKIKENRTNNTLERQFKENFNKLKRDILKWEYNYLIISPIEGRVSFLSVLNKNKHIQMGEEMFSIVPHQQDKIIGKLTIPMRNSGKVKKGQEVNICLESYPCEEWGMLKGIVKNISLVPSKGFYSIDVEIPQGMRTSYGKKLKYKQEMEGTAKVITEKLRLIDRLFFQLRKISNR